MEKDDRSGTTSLPLLSAVPHPVTAGKAHGWLGLWKQRGCWEERGRGGGGERERERERERETETEKQRQTDRQTETETERKIGKEVGEGRRQRWVEKDDRSGTTSLPLLSAIPHSAYGWLAFWKQTGYWRKRETEKERDDGSKER